MSVGTLSIPHHFASLRDPRRQHGQLHRLLDILVIALCAVIAGSNTWQEVETFAHRRRDWLGRFLDLPNGVPSHDTFERVFDRLDPLALQRCLLSWLNALCGAPPIGHIAIDGKTARRSGSPTRGIQALHLVSAWATEHSLTLGQVATEEKSNEITAIPELLELLELEGALVTIDAMGCQKAIAAKITEGGGDYVLTVKDNQERLCEDVVSCLCAAMDDEAARREVHEYEERGHGRVERRAITVLSAPEGIRDQESWPGLKVVGSYYVERTEAGETSEEIRFFIGSREMTAKKYGEAIRGHWQVENGLHWSLDVSFREDDSRIRKRAGGANFALLRKIALSLLKRHPSKDSINRKRYAAALDTAFLEEIITLHEKLGDA
ncbi:MAG: ISAs1 family transposase [Gemmataceae bacterium]